MARFSERFSFVFDSKNHRRLVCNKEVIIHCHHYNSRLQRTIEGSKQIDGKQIIRKTAAIVFADYLKLALRSQDSEADKWTVAEELYAHLGYGQLDFSRVLEGVVRSPSSHYVEGWLAGFGERKEPVCTFTEGVIQGFTYVITGKVFDVVEEACLITGAEACIFKLTPSTQKEIPVLEKKTIEFKSERKKDKYLHSNNVNEQAILDAVVSMPIYGNEKGLIPAFSVFLASTPADFYNLICLQFLEEMSKKKLVSSARRMLIADAETCGMNTFRGIMNSAEWEALVAPMIKDEPDNLYALVAISNALGWGDWHIVEHVPAKTLKIESVNGYEALGHREIVGKAEIPQCLMLTGVAAGLMELVYSKGSIKDRFGTFVSNEESCIACGSDSCEFEVKPVV